MTELEQLLTARGAGAPLVIWLIGSLILSVLFLSIVVLCVRNLHVEWKGKTRFFRLKTDNSEGKSHHPSRNS